MVMEQRCERCGKVLGPEAFLGPVCGKCVRIRHAEVVGRRLPRRASKKRIEQNPGSDIAAIFAILGVAVLGYIVLKDKGYFTGKVEDKTVAVPLTVVVVKKTAETEAAFLAELKTAKYEDAEALSQVGWYIVVLPEKKKMATALTEIKALTTVESVVDSSTIKVSA